MLWLLVAVMTVFRPFEGGVEVKGQAILSIVNGVPSAFTHRAEEILADNGIEDIDPEEWYPQEAYLDAYREVAENVGETTLRQIGRSTPANADWPPGVDTPLAALQSIDDAYRMNHRGGEIGYYDATELDDGRVKMECKNPYPCVYDQGLIEGTVKEFCDTFSELNETGAMCRDDGEEVCVYEVKWSATHH
jgi:predicted hydrocarbon binding protein